MRGQAEKWKFDPFGRAFRGTKAGPVRHARIFERLSPTEPLRVAKAAGTIANRRFSTSSRPAYIRPTSFPPAMKKILSLSVVALFAGIVARAEPTRADLIDRVQTCEAILQDFQARTVTAIPAQVWQRAKGLIILNQFKAGLLLGVKDGYGVIMVKKPNGSWSLPVLINAGEASLGFQLGAKTVESIYIITDEATPRMLFSNRFNIGVDAKAVAGPRAAETERNREEILRTPLLAYIKSTGLYAGATVKAGHISRNDKSNFDLYSTRYTLPELLYSDWIQPVPEVQPLMDLVRRLAP
jgi:SH3 domain-containing YSC84-like protein 1